jgi:hypothetical protein
MFKEERAQADEQIRQRLADMAITERPHRATSLSSSRLRPNQRADADSGARSGIRRPRVALWGTLAAVGLLSLAFAVLWISRRNETPAQHVAPPSSVLASDEPAPQVVPEPPRITVRLAATPRQARLALDGVELPSNPHTLHVPMDRSRHWVRAAAPGHRPAESSVVYDRNATVSLDLVRLTRRHHSVKPEASVPAPAPREADALPDCSEPSYIDDRGIKRFRPECMGR